ncbi:MAG: filamentous hemagglutinin N-terminal domain-containing protein [Burkholderiales bacterium]
MGSFSLGRLLATTTLVLVTAAPASREAAALGSVSTQITTDPTLHNNVQYFTGPGTVLDASLGTIKGNNLFHSFSTFNVGSGDTVYFSGPSSIQNIITRVTGGSASLIDGTIDTLYSPSPMDKANFFLINPSGIMFGGSAGISIGGSFHATTADYLKFSDGTKFDAKNHESSNFSYSEPLAFGFLTANPASIALQESILILPNDGNTISLAGGDLQLNQAFIGFPSRGRVNLFSVLSPGEIGLDGSSNIQTFGNISSDASTINVPGGPLTIRAGDVILTNGSFVFGGPDPNQFVNPLVDISAANLTLDQFSQINLLNQVSLSSGTVKIRVDNLKVLNGSGIINNAFNNLNPGISGAFSDIDIDATSSILIAGAFTTLGSIAGGKARAGNIKLTSPSIAITSKAQIIAKTSGIGIGGTISLIGEQVLIEQGATVTTSTSGAGNAGQIIVNAGRAYIGSGSKILAEASSSGDAGNIEILAKSTIFIQGGSIGTSADFSNGGIITIKAGELLRLDGGSISTSVKGAAGNSGNINIDPPIVILQNGSSIVANAFLGKGGNISIVAGGVLQSPDSSIDASSKLGIDGTVSIDAPGAETQRGLALMLAKFSDPDAQLRASCAARHIGGSVSSLIGVGRGGTAASPDGQLAPSYSVVDNKFVSTVFDRNAISSANFGRISFGRFGDC